MINGRLRQCLQQCLPVLVMLFAHLGQVLDGSLDNRFHLLVLRITGLNAAQYPICCELDPRPYHLRIVGSVSKMAPRTAPGPKPPAGTWLRVRIQADTACQHAPQQDTSQRTREEATA